MRRRTCVSRQSAEPPDQHGVNVRIELAFEFATTIVAHRQEDLNKLHDRKCFCERSTRDSFFTRDSGWFATVLLFDRRSAVDERPTSTCFSVNCPLGARRICPFIRLDQLTSYGGSPLFLQHLQNRRQGGSVPGNP